MSRPEFGANRVCVGATLWLSLSAICSLLLATACGGGGGSPTGPSTVTITDVTVTGPASLTAIGEKAQFTATARLSDGSMQDQTNAAQWETSDPLVVSVSSTGLVTAAGGGGATVRATFQGVTGTKQLEVLPGPPVATSDVAGRIENLETVADLIAYHQDAVGWRPSVARESSRAGICLSLSMWTHRKVAEM